MKKLIISLLILVLAGGAIFYFGWIQILLPLETYGVVFTKTGGYDSRVIKPGVFSWRWERLIPNNMTLYQFDLKPHTTEIDYQHSLPSSVQFASLLPEKANFNFEATISLRFRLNPDRLPDLVAEEMIAPGELADYYQQKASEIAPRIMELALQEQEARGSSAAPRIADSQPSSMELLPNPEGDRRLKAQLQREYPDLEIVSLHSVIKNLPDLELYRLAKESYLGLMKSRELALNEAAPRIALEREMALVELEKERATLKIMSEYGELFTRYPVLLKFYYLQKLSGSGSIELPELNPRELFEGSEPEGP